MMETFRSTQLAFHKGTPMNSPKVVVALGLILICGIVLTACGGGGSKPTPPAGPPTIETATLPLGAVNAPYLVNGNPVVLSAIGGTSPYTWSIASGSLPPGLSLDPAQGVISGTPTAAGNFSFTAKVTDAANMSATANLSIYIQGVVSITPTTLPSGSAGVAYTNPNGSPVQLTATGGVAPYTWCVLAGSTCDPTQAGLPAGLTLNTTTGVISGTPATNGPPVSFMIQVSDSETLPGHAAIGTSSFTITIMAITGSLPSGYLNTPYTATLTVAGGIAPYAWTAANLPPGLFLDPSCGSTKLQTCAVKGTPTQAGLFNATIKVMDGEKLNPAVAGVSFSVNVYQSSQLVFVTTALPPGTEGVPYSTTLTASGGLPPYNWSIISGKLPPGLALDPTTCTNSSVPCVISGTPTTSGPFVFTVQLQDSGSGQQQQTVSQQFSILIVNPPPLVITTTSLPAGLVGVPYNATLTAVGGVKPYTWCIFESDGITCDNGSGILPSGLTLNQSSGVISGTPTSPGTSSFKVQVTDSGNPQQKVTTQLSIAVTSLGNGTLNGSYAFTFDGYKNGGPVVMAGSFVPDGNGNITSGVLDYNDGTGEPVDGSGNPIPQTIQAGSGSVYNITPNGLGTMTITTNEMVFQLAIAIRSDGSGRLIQSDPANPQAYGSGIIEFQAPTTTWPLCGSHVALGLLGWNNSLTGRYAAAGEFQFDPTTCVDAENGAMDVDNAGTVSSATFSGAFNQWNTNTGRGIAGITFNPGGRHFHAFYLVSSADHKRNELILVSTEPVSQPANLTLWSSLQQATPPTGWDNTNLTGTGVAEFSALDTAPAVDVTAGLFTGQGVSQHNCQGMNNDPATFTFDENQGGVCNGGSCGSQPQSTTGTYCVDKNTGRVTLTGFSGAFGGLPPVFYLIKSNQAFVVGTDTAVTSGYLEPQTGSPFSNSSLFGLYAGGSINPVTKNVTNSVSVLVADGGGNINGNESTSGPGGPQQQPFTYTYMVDNTGRAVVQQNGSTIGIAYVVSSTKFVLLPATDPNPALSIVGE